MTYGTSRYGQSSYGGSSLEQQAPYLSASTPASGATGVAVGASLLLSIVVPAGVDLNQLSVTIGSAQAIVGGRFLAGYGGTILADPETSLEIVISTHPDFSGSTTVTATVVSLAGATTALPISFTTASASITVTETLTGSATVATRLNAVCTAAASNTLSESVQLTWAPRTVTVSETLAGSSQATATRQLACTVAASNTLSESITTAIGPRTVTVSESVTQSAATTIRQNLIVATTDNLSVVDAASTGSRLDVGEVLTQSVTVAANTSGGSITVSESLGASATVQTQKIARALVGEVLSSSATVGTVLPSAVHVAEALHVGDFLTVGATAATNFGGDWIALSLSARLQPDGSADTKHYSVTSTGVPTKVLGAFPLAAITATGSAGSYLGTLGYQVQLDTILQVSNLGNSLSIMEGPNKGLYRIEAITQFNPAIVTLDRPITADPASSLFSWEVAGGVHSVLLHTTKLTDQAAITVRVEGLLDYASGKPASITVDFRAEQVPHPEVASVVCSDKSVITVTFGEPMFQDHAITNVGDYTITGPTPVRVRRVRAISPTQVALETTGLSTGNYQLTVSTSTPRDLGGNPMSPTGNQMAFQAQASVIQRCLYTDRGPISKPPLTLQQGVQGMIETAREVTLIGGTFSAQHVGKYVTLTGTARNDGTYEILSLISSSRVVLRASLSLPDTQNGTFSWTLKDPRHGQIADSPQDVTVRVNGTPVTVESVNGLLGQITLQVTPASQDSVQVDYHWIDNPTVQIRGFNRTEFRLNNWNRNGRTTNRTSQHFYRYNNVLPNPARWAQPIGVALPQPTERDVRYRAYEVAYSALMNRKDRLRFNTPRRKVAYPKTSRLVSESFVPYEALQVPELEPVNPWVLKGSGPHSCLAGRLTCQDTSSSEALFWTRPIDLTFQHVFAMSWHAAVQVVTQPDGVWLGCGAGYSDPLTGVVFGYLLDGTVKRVGFLRKGETATDRLSSWDSIPLDWSVVRTYRIYRSTSGQVRLYVDGSPTPSLTIESADLPLIADCPTPFDAIQGVWFGSMSRPARVTSEWDFVRYQVIPTNSTQYGYSGILDYSASVLPESATRPWTPVGAGGSDHLLGGGLLMVSNQGAAPYEPGAMEGSYRSFARIEPLLGTASQVSVEARLQGLAATFGADPNGLTLTVNDGSRLIQSSWIQDREFPKLSYGGTVEPEQYGAYGWARLGTAQARMSGHNLLIEDQSAGDGLVFYCDDLAPNGTPARTLDTTGDWALEARFRVLSYTPDGAGFCGGTAQVFDGTRSCGFALINTGTPAVALTSDGNIVAQWNGNWANQDWHQIRIRKSVTGDQLSVFLDDQLLGTHQFSLIPASAPQPEGQITFGSATPISTGSVSTVEWSSCNAWRIDAARRYWGLWNGGTTNTLLDFHLPVRSTGYAKTLGNALQDPTATWVSSGVLPGHLITVPYGANQGVYEVDTVLSDQSLTITGLWPVQTEQVPYSIPVEVDWTQIHTYRIDRTFSGEVQLRLDGTLIGQVSYGATLPAIQGVIQQLSDGLPSVIWGSLSSPHLGSSLWDFLRYQITRSDSDNTAVPHLQVLNQWNVMHSGERLRTQIPHQLTSFRSSSTGIPPHTDPDLLANPAMRGITILNEGTPIVPLRQAIRGQLASLYTCLDQITLQTGQNSLISPFTDSVQITGLQWTKRVCLAYDGSDLPEDTVSGTPWVLASDVSANVYRAVGSGGLVYGTSGLAKTVYKNNTPLLDAVSLPSRVRFRVRVNQDSTLGIGDSQIRLGFSAPEMTIGLAFRTHAQTMERFVNVLDMNTGLVLGACTFDYLDGQFHTYQLLRDPTSRQVLIQIDP